MEEKPRPTGSGFDEELIGMRVTLGKREGACRPVHPKNKAWVVGYIRTQFGPEDTGEGEIVVADEMLHVKWDRIEGFYLLQP